MRTPLVLVLVVTSVACATGSQITTLPSPPSASAPLVERDAYYEQKKPAGVAGVPNAVNQFGWLVQPKFPVLVLADGSRIAEATALASAVDEGSRTALAAQKAADLRVATNTVYTASTLGLTFGLLAMLSSPVFFVGGVDPVPGIILYTAGAAAGLAGALGLGWATELAEEAEAEKMVAFFVYEADLRRRLGLVRPDEILERKWLTPKTKNASRSEQPPVLVPSPPPAAVESPDNPSELSPEAAPLQPAP